MTAAEYNFILEQGVTMPKSFQIKDSAGNVISLAGATVKMQARLTKDSDDALFTLTSVGGAGFTIDGSNTITFVWSALNFATLDFTEAVYDIQVTFVDGKVMRVVEGTIVYSKRVTQ